MDPRTFPTKGNLMLAKNSLALAKQGYDLMDKKRNILIRELMDLIDEARSIQEEIDTTFTYAYQCLQRANIENGISNVELLAYTVPIENSITIQTRSIMGTEIPHVKYIPDAGKPTYSFSTTHESIDKKYLEFGKEFEERYIGQGADENRSMEETLNLGWELLGRLPKEELDRVDTKILDKYYKPMPEE